MELFQDLVKAKGCISSPFNSYEVQKILGSGSFGLVTLCRKNSSDQKVALKMVKNASGAAEDLVKAKGCISSPFNSYEVQKILGVGSFGLVTLCRKNGSDQKVALKMVKNAPGAAEAQCMEFLAMCGSASHHIVEMFGSFNFNGTLCLQFEALDISLGDFLKKSSSLPLHQIRPIITQMAEALMFLKRINVIHGDLKPDNVMMVDHVGKPLQVKIIDFGLARPVQLATPGSFFGTLYYSAPEMAIGAPMHHSLDMWSLGCIAAEMYLGRLLFSAADNSDLMNPHDSAVDMGLFVDLIQQLLDLDPDSRINPLEVLKHPFTNRTQVHKPCPHLESQSSSSPSLSETPPVSQTCGLKRKREEEEECPEKRRFKGEDFVIRYVKCPLLLQNLPVVQSVSALQWYPVIQSVSALQWYPVVQGVLALLIHSPQSTTRYLLYRFPLCSSEFRQRRSLGADGSMGRGEEESLIRDASGEGLFCSATLSTSGQCPKKEGARSGP
uniref:Protein kinase domain-containing protein n=1 Tax=Knipowitschia caucasica TaxID=637954 RepID=A0AAV2J8T2_KNICA